MKIKRVLNKVSTDIITANEYIEIEEAIKMSNDMLSDINSHEDYFGEELICDFEKKKL
jgi:hypothetical protein